MSRSPWLSLPRQSLSFASTSIAIDRSRQCFKRIGILAAAGLLFCAGGLIARAQTTYSGGGAITATGVNGSGSSTLSVSGASGSVKTVYVTLNGVTSNGLDCCDSVYFTSFVLESPGGTKMVLLGGTGDSIDGDDNEDSGSGLKNSTITIEDGQAAAPEGNAWTPQGHAFTVEPSSYWLLPNLNGPQYASLPSDIDGDKLPQTDGTSPDGPDSGNATLNGTFANDNANGNWTLYILTDDTFASNDVVSVSGWSLTFTFNTTVAAPTTTTVSTNTANPASTVNSITYTATVTSTSTVNTGTVAFTANGATISGCGAQPVSNGTATCSTTLSNQGLYAIQADYTAGTGFESSSSSNLEQLVEHPSTEPTTNRWCNTNSLTVPGQSLSLAYPSVIKVSGYPAGTTVGNVEVELENVTGIIDAQSLLVAPNGTSNLDFFDYGFNQGDSVSSGITLNFYDSAGAYPDPDNGPTGGATYNYEASDTLPPGNTDTFTSSSAPTYDSSIPQVPGTVNYGYDQFYPTKRGAITETFESNFNGAPANGTWALYSYEGDAVTETINSGWCIALTINPGTPTTTTLTSNANPQTPQQPVTLTAAVKSGSSPVTSGGTVTFLENGTAPQGTSGGDNVVNLDTSTGQASFTTGTLSSTITIDAENSTSTTKTVYEGDFALSADYSGDTSDNPSTGDLVQRFDNTTSFSAGSGGSFNACNAGPVLLSNGVEGAFAPNPSNIFVANLPGTLNTVTLTLNGFFTANQDAIDFTEALIKGPTGAALDFFSNTGNNSSVLGGTTSPWGNLTFADSASSILPSSGNYAPGSYKPTAYQGSSSTDSFTSSSSGFYNAPGSFNYAQPHGSSTFASTFNSTNPNGTWSLFFNTTDFVAAEGAQSGWCLNFTENPVTVGVTESHSGTGTSGAFVQGETNAQFTTVVENTGNGPTGDPLGTNPLKVTDTIPTGLTYAGTFSGTGWSCTGTTTVTCTNDSPVSSGSSYPMLTLNVNVSTNAPSSISNSVSVSGAGITSNSASDTIPVDATPVLALSKSHTGTFTQGSTGTWTLTVSNTAANGSTSGTVNVSDSLPSGYTLSSYSSANSSFTCSGSSSVICTGIPGIAGGSSNTIMLIVNVPSNSPVSVSNTATASGGGAVATATSNTDTVSVAQVPASISILGGNNQSSTVTAPFASPLTVQVLDGGGVPIANEGVTFTVVTISPASGTFQNSSTIITGNTNGSGEISEMITANTFAGSFGVQVQTATGSGSAVFNLTNTAAAAADISILGGNNQSAQDGQGFSSPLSVLLTDQFGNAVQGQTVTFNAPTTGASLTFAGGVNTAITNSGGQATSAAITANSLVGAYTVTATSGALQQSFSMSNTVGPITQFGINVPPSTYAGIPLSFTVIAQDAGGNTETNYSGTVTFSSTDTAASLPGPSTLTNGTGTFTATLNTLGSQTITATDSVASVSSTSGSITVIAIPYFVVNTAADDSGTATNCSQQTSPGTNSGDSACSLRDALLAAGSAGAGAISFDSTAFASAQTITLGSTGTLNIPAYTSITGATTGSGPSLTNLVTVSGAGGSNGQFSDFNVNNGVNGTAISNLIITNGTGTPNSGEPVTGGGIDNQGTLTVTNITFTGNTAQAGGAIVTAGTLTVTGSTFSANMATGSDGLGGAIVNSGSLTVTNSTFSGNSTGAAGAGGAIVNAGTMTVTNSTFSGNSAGAGGAGGAIFNPGTPPTVTNSIFTQDVDGECAGAGCPTNGANGNLLDPTGTTVILAPLGSYGGPTQTMVPEPGSAAICAGAASSVPSGVTTDQRGEPIAGGGYCPSGNVDSGSVQTNYAISFTTQPPATTPQNVALTPAPVVSLTESGAAFTAANSGTVSMSDSATLLGGTTTATLTGGAATFSNLTLTGATSNDMLTATLPLNGPIDVTSTAATGVTALLTQTITFGAIAAQPIFSTYTLSASSSSGLPITYYTSTPSFCTINGGTVTLEAIGYCNVFATQPGNNVYGPAAWVGRNIEVVKASQSITFPMMTPQPVNTTYTLPATASSGLPITYTTSTPTICTINGETANLIAIGYCGVYAAQPGNTDYSPATRVARNLEVVGTPQTITFPAISPQPAQTTVTLTASASSGLPVTFASTTPALCTVSGNTASLLAPGYCGIEATQAGNSTYAPATAGRNILIEKAPQTITFPAMPAQPVNTTYTLPATASSGLPITYTTSTPTICTIVNSNQAQLLAVGYCGVYAAQPGNSVYAAATTVARNLQVVK